MAVGIGGLDQIGTLYKEEGDYEKINVSLADKENMRTFLIRDRETFEK